MPGGQSLGLWSHEARRQARRLNDAALDVERREVGGPDNGYNVTRIDGLSENPVVAIYLTRRRLERLPEVCGPASPNADG